MSRLIKLLGKLDKLQDNLEKEVKKKVNKKTSKKSTEQQAKENADAEKEEVVDDIQTRAKAKKGQMFKGCKEPSDKSYFEICSASYEAPKKRPMLINDWWQYQAKISTPTVAVYQDKLVNSVVIAYRGTQMDVQDIVADKNIMFNRLTDSPRYQADSKATTEILKSYEDQFSEICFFLTGHSLGNAIQLQIHRDFKIGKSGRGYNGALQPRDLVRTPKNFSFWYIKGDPLYELSGRFLRKGLVLFPRVAKSNVKNHSLVNFKGLTKADAVKRGGGKLKPPTKNDLVKLGYGHPDDKIVELPNGVKLPETALVFYQKAYA